MGRSEPGPGATVKGVIRGSLLVRSPNEISTPNDWGANRGLNNQPARRWHQASRFRVETGVQLPLGLASGGRRPIRSTRYQGGFGSGGSVVLVDDPPEDVTATNLAGVQGVVAGRWGSELQAPVRTGLVVIVHVLGEHGLQMAPGVHKKLFEALFTYGPHPTLCECVRLWRPNRCANGLDTDRGKHLVEAGGELRIPVSDDEPDPTAILFEVSGEVAGHRGHPCHRRVGRHPEKVHDATVHFDHEKDVVAP